MAWFREDFWQAWQGSTVRRQVVVLHEAPENCRIMRVNPGTFFVSQHEGQQRPLPAPLVLTQWEQNELMSVPGCRKAKKRCFVKPQTAPKGTGLNTGLTFLLLHHSQSIPDVWFWVSNLILRGFGLFSGNKASCSILVTHYLINTMMYEQPHKYNDAQLQYKHSHC